MKAQEYTEEEKERNTQDLLALANEGVITVRIKEYESKEEFFKNAKMYFRKSKTISFDENEIKCSSCIFSEKTSIRWHSFMCKKTHKLTNDAEYRPKWCPEVGINKIIFSNAQFDTNEIASLSISQINEIIKQVFLNKEDKYVSTDIEELLYDESVKKDKKLTIQQYLQDIRNGFNLDKMISILSNVDEEQVHEMVSEGKITMDTYNKAIKEIMLLQIKAKIK